MMETMTSQEREAVIAVLNEMRESATGSALFYAEKLAAALGEPRVITPELLASGRLTM